MYIVNFIALLVKTHFESLLQISFRVYVHHRQRNCICRHLGVFCAFIFMTRLSVKRFDVLRRFEPWKLTNDFNDIREADTAVYVAHRASVVSRIRGDQVFQDHAPGVVLDDAKVSLGIPPVFVPRYVGGWITTSFAT